MNDEELKDCIMDKAYHEGDFTLRSGRKSHYIIDKYGFETDPDILREIASRLADMLPPDTDRLAGVELGGVPLVTALALHCSIPYVIVRKNEKGHGLDRPFEGEMKAGEHVVLVEDIATTGGAALKAAEVLRENDAGKVSLLLVADRQEGAAEAFENADIDYKALYTRESLGIEAD